MCNDVYNIKRKQSLPRNITISRIPVYTESYMDNSMNAQEEVSGERCPQELTVSERRDLGFCLSWVLVYADCNFNNHLPQNFFPN